MSDYATDLLLWSERQADLLRQIAAEHLSNTDSPDWDHIIEEVLAVGNTERDKLESRIGTIIEHLMKLEASPAANPRNKWKLTILAARRDVARILKRTPSLNDALTHFVSEELPLARQDAGKALAFFKETPVVDINALAYTPDEIIGEWFPPDND